MLPIPWVLMGLVFVVVVVISVPMLRRQMLDRQRRQLIDAKQQFYRLREQLEAKFLQRAGLTGKPRGLRWADCEFEDEVTYARDRQTGRLSAFVAMCIKFEAIEGGGMEDVEAVANHKYGTAVFHFDPKHCWMTEGRAIFNLGPREAMRRFDGTLEPIG
ncbi:MAG: hypothetical protein IT427_03235 [Pirellulales bacterium]|nr:hypothetical protein [Pirellulales bacterium]